MFVGVSVTMGFSDYNWPTFCNDHYVNTGFKAYETQTWPSPGGGVVLSDQPSVPGWNPFDTDRADGTSPISQLVSSTGKRTITSRPYKPGVLRCKACVDGRGEHAVWCPARSVGCGFCIPKHCEACPSCPRKSTPELRDRVLSVFAEREWLSITEIVRRVNLVKPSETDAIIRSVTILFSHGSLQTRECELTGEPVYSARSRTISNENGLRLWCGRRRHAL